MSHRQQPHGGNARKSTNSVTSAREASYLSNAFDADQSTLYNALSGAGFGRSAGQQIDDTLLEAVTSAAGADLRNGMARGSLSLRGGDVTNQQEAAEEAVSLLDRPKPSPGKGKRKRNSDAPSRPSDGIPQRQFNFRNTVTMPSPAKRQRTNQHARQTTPPSPDDLANGADTSTATTDASVFFSEYTSPLNMSDARASGVYSAAALFRKPTEASRKYTRPPMSKLFTSLELSPENFIRLQSAAKAYMLDPAHEERQNCVGNRAKLTKFDDSKGDTDMTKLRLYHCVKEFLETGGLAEDFFGRQSEGAARRNWFWPRDVNKVISLVTPLLRRMITNERQRQYALETRKAPNTSGRATREKKRKAATEASTAPSSRSESQEVNSQLDPQLASHDKVGTRSSAAATQPNGWAGNQARDPITSLRFAVVGGGISQDSSSRRFIHSFNREYRGQSFSEICEEAQTAYDRDMNKANGGDVSLAPPEERRWALWVLVDSGRKQISSGDDWEEALRAAETRMPYINGELTVIVELQ